MLSPQSVMPSDVAQLHPNNIEAESAILGGLLLDENALTRVQKFLPDAEPFYLENHRTIYKAILGAASGPNGVVDAITVCTLLKSAPSREYEHKLAEVGGQSAIIGLLDRTISTVNIDKYAELVRDKWVRRKAIAAAREIERLAYREELEVGAMVNGCEQQLAEVSQLIRTTEVVKLGDALQEVCTEIEAIQSGAVQPGIPSGFYDFDALTQGFNRGDLLVLAGRPSMGKTAYALACSWSVARQGHAVLIVSLEMNRKQLATRSLSNTAQIDSGRIRTGRVSDQEWETIGHALVSSGELPVYLDDGWQPNVAEIHSKAAEIKAKHGSLGLLVIDYFQLLEGAGDRQEFLSRTVRQLKKMASVLDTTIILLSQLNRGVESRTNKRPLMSDLRETGSIEQDADLIAMLYREEYYDPDTPERGIVEIILTKNRNGPTGTAKLLFDGSFGEFKNRSQRV